MRFLSALLLLTLVACDNDDGVTDGTDAGPGAAACGNGTVEGDEACDDGNAIDVDGCLDPACWRAAVMDVFVPTFPRALRGLRLVTTGT
jgi:cysteine-rich repeat protein